MKKLKMYVTIAGVSLISIISIILAFSLDCKLYGVYIAIFDVLSIFLFIFLARFIINFYFKKIEQSQKFKNFLIEKCKKSEKTNITGNHCKTLKESIYKK